MQGTDDLELVWGYRTITFTERIWIEKLAIRWFFIDVQSVKITWLRLFLSVWGHFLVLFLYKSYGKENTNGNMHFVYVSLTVVDFIIIIIIIIIIITIMIILGNSGMQGIYTYIPGQTMSLANTVLQLFWCYYSWCSYR
jgi:hypothetical protein